LQRAASKHENGELEMCNKRAFAFKDDRVWLEDSAAKSKISRGAQCLQIKNLFIMFSLFHRLNDAHAHSRFARHTTVRVSYGEQAPQGKGQSGLLLPYLVHERTRRFHLQISSSKTLDQQKAHKCTPDPSDHLEQVTALGVALKHGSARFHLARLPITGAEHNVKGICLVRFELKLFDACFRVLSLENHAVTCISQQQTRM
jgi:hypothetical protein